MDEATYFPLDGDRNLKIMDASFGIGF